jgi:hypothetical protein
MTQIGKFICLIAIAFLGVSAMAQSPTGTVQGLVTDKNLSSASIAMRTST